MHRHLVVSQPSAALVLVMLAGGSNVLRDVLAIAVGVKFGPVWDPSNFVR